MSLLFTTFVILSSVPEDGLIEIFLDVSGDTSSAS